MDFENLGKRYFGKTAASYNEQRTSDEKWPREQEIMETLLGALPAGTRLIDIPVGTGRFLPLYQKFRLAPIGMDISEDMLSEARETARKSEFDVPLKHADIRHIEVEDGAVDGVVCIRFLNWVDCGGVEIVMAELNRVARSFLIVGIRHFTPIGEIALFSRHGLWRWLRQKRAQLRKCLGKEELVIHIYPDIERIFSRLNLNVGQAVCVEKRRDGTDYYLYLLRKHRP